MSTCISAIMSHQWLDFSFDKIEQIQLAIFKNVKVAAPKLVSQSGKAETDFENYGEVLCRLASGYSIKYCKNVLTLSNDSRWSAFLMHNDVRENFLTACYSLAEVTKAMEILILPQGTILEEALNDGADFQALKDLASKTFGLPDLDIQRFYSEFEIGQMAQKRIHFFLTNYNP